MDFGEYHRFSPTAFVPLMLLDKHVIAPLSGISGTRDPRFLSASRLRIMNYFFFALLALLVFRFALRIGLPLPSAAFAGLYVGLHKGLAYSLCNVSIPSALLMVIYALGACFTLIRFVRGGAKSSLALYYLFLILTVGAWEMWVDFYLILAVSGVVAWRCWPERARRLLIHAVGIPTLLFAGYLWLRFPLAHSEFSQPTEAQFIFAYSSLFLQIEEVFSNLSLHVLDCFDSAVFPWPALSFSLIQNANMDLANAYNATYTAHPSVIYRAFASWYAGGFLTAYLILLGYLLVKLNRSRQGLRSFLIPILSLAAVPLGCAIHLPIMHRTYYLMPGYFLTYSHLFSLLGTAVFLAWVLQRVRLRYGKTAASRAFGAGVAWILFCNIGKLSLSHGMQFPW